MDRSSPTGSDSDAGPSQPAGQPSYDDLAGSLLRGPPTPPVWQRRSPSPPLPQPPASPAASSPSPPPPPPPGPDSPAASSPSPPPPPGPPHLYQLVPRAGAPNGPPATLLRPRQPAALKRPVHTTFMPSGCAGANRASDVMIFAGPPRGTLPRPPVPAPEVVQLPHPAAPVQEHAPLEPLEEDVPPSPQHGSPPPPPEEVPVDPSSSTERGEASASPSGGAAADSGDPSAAAAAAAADPVAQQQGKATNVTTHAEWQSLGSLDDFDDDS
ncbi:extensin [Triticum aestivum]|uniref:extensin n=1 Tax=Triticum aestivum TaxID=4565 RepID=UPI001D02D414|nr:extensin-like [Triticum aestivum]